MGYGRISGGHRKSGQRGGVGRAGTYKHHNILRIKEGFRETHKGFYPHGSPQPARITNLGELDFKIDRLLEAGKLEKDGDKIKIDAKSLGFDKLLGKGRVTHPLIVTVKTISAIARSKIEAAGGEVIIP